MKKTSIFLGALFATLSMAADQTLVFSGHLFDGIIRTADNQLVVATAGDGEVIQFDLQGNSQVLATNGGYILGVAQDTMGNIYASDT